MVLLPGSSRSRNTGTWEQAGAPGPEEDWALPFRRHAPPRGCWLARLLWGGDRTVEGADEFPFVGRRRPGHHATAGRPEETAFAAGDDERGFHTGHDPFVLVEDRITVRPREDA